MGDKYGLTLLLRKLYFDTISVFEGLKSMFLINSTTVLPSKTVK